MLLQSSDEFDSNGDISPVFILDPDADNPDERKLPLGMLIQTLRVDNFIRHFIHSVEENSFADQFKFRYDHSNQTTFVVMK